MSNEMITETLQDVFGFSRFRPHQEEIVRALLARRDVFAVMPTGAGKSLCYQLPAVMLPGVCLVISPLISLMKDQVDAARTRGIRAAFLNSSQGADARREVTQALRAGELDLLYASPERFSMASFIDLLKSTKLAFVAIDEAHCISSWGHDFRPDYLLLSDVKRHFPDCPVAAFTATATRKVAADIVSKLSLHHPHQLRASFNRENLFYEVQPKTDADHQLLGFVHAHRDEHGIIYRMTRKAVEETADMLTANGIKALPYHAGLDDKTRMANQEAFDRDEIDVVVATIAFGMGIDKPNIRYVVHGDLPKNIESYYQETGRAGRDGQPAHCLLLFGFGDVPRIRYFIDQISDPTAQQHERRCLKRMIDYCEVATCRRRQLLGYFDERFPHGNCGTCDVCNPNQTKTLKTDVTVAAQMLMSAMIRTGNRFGAGHIIDLVKGAKSKKLFSHGHDQLSTYGVGRKLRRGDLQTVLNALVAQGLVDRTGDAYPVLAVGATATPILKGETCFFCQMPERKAGQTAAKPRLPVKPRRTPTTAATVALLEQGKTFEAVAAERELTVETIINHVERHLDAGERVNVDLADSIDVGKRDAIADVLEQQETNALKPVFDHFNGDVSYEEIKLTRLWRKLQHGGAVRAST